MISFDYKSHFDSGVKSSILLMKWNREQERDTMQSFGWCASLGRMCVSMEWRRKRYNQESAGSSRYENEHVTASNWNRVHGNQLDDVVFSVSFVLSPSLSHYCFDFNSYPVAAEKYEWIYWINKRKSHREHLTHALIHSTSIRMKIKVDGKIIWNRRAWERKKRNEKRCSIAEVCVYHELNAYATCPLCVLESYFLHCNYSTWCTRRFPRSFFHACIFIGFFYS